MTSSKQYLQAEDSDSPWVDVSDEIERMEAENAALKLALETAKAAPTAPTPAGTQAPAPAEAPTIPSREQIQADVDAVDLNQSPSEFYAQLSAASQPVRPAPESKPQLTRQEIEAKLAEAKTSDELYAKLDEIGELDQSAWGSGKQVFTRVGAE